MKIMKVFKYLQAFVIYVWVSTPYIMCVITFATYVKLGYEINAPTVRILFLISCETVNSNEKLTCYPFSYNLSFVILGIYNHGLTQYSEYSTQ